MEDLSSGIRSSRASGFDPRPLKARAAGCEATPLTPEITLADAFVMQLVGAAAASWRRTRCWWIDGGEGAFAWPRDGSSGNMEAGKGKIRLHTLLVGWLVLAENEAGRVWYWGRLGLAA